MSQDDVADEAGLGLIDKLLAAKGGYFFRRTKRITDKAIADAFRKVRKDARNPRQNLFRHDRMEHLGSRWSAIAFMHDRDPSFLAADAGVTEQVAGFLLVVERGDSVALFRSGLDLPASFKTTHLQKMPGAAVERALAHSDAIFEKIRLRNMSRARHALRTKALEASDLQNNVGLAGASRFIPQSYTLRRDDGHYSATPSTGRISLRDDKVPHLALVDWAGGIIDELARDEGREVSPFIRNFARPVDLSTLPAGTLPTSFAVNVPVLVDLILEDKLLQLVRKTDDGDVVLDAKESAAVLEALDVTLTAVRTRDGEADLRLPESERVVGRIKINKSRIALRALDWPGLEDLQVAPTAASGDTSGPVDLRTHLEAHNRFIILFSDLNLTYIDGDLFRDETLTNGGAGLLSHLLPQKVLAVAKSEKGDLVEDQAGFDSDSVFGIVVTDLSKDDALLVCDDLGDEWADFIGLGMDSNPRTINFYHAKHGGLSLSASAFHVSVSQAMKNLGRMALAPESMGKKYETWSSRYANFGVKAAMPRIIRGDSEELQAGVETVRSAPDTLRRAYIVTSSLSKKVVRETLDSAKEGVAPPPHFVHLYWLLLSFFSACSEVGAFGYVICQE